MFLGCAYLLYMGNRLGFFDKYKYWMNYMKIKLEEKKKSDKIIEASFKEQKKRQEYNDIN